MTLSEQIAMLKQGFDLSTEDGRTRCYLSSMLRSITKDPCKIDSEAITMLGIELRVTEAAMLRCIENL